MPTLTFDGVFDPQPRRLDIAALDLQGFLDASYADLRAAFGPPSIDAVPDGAGAMWHIITPAGPVELFDYDNPDSPQEYPAQRAGWHLAADDLSALPWIYQHVLGSTEDFPRLTLSRDVVAITEAYILYLSHQASGWKAKERAGELKWLQARSLFVPLHRSRTLLLDVLLADEWAAADETQRQAWQALPEPRLRHRLGDPEYLSGLRARHRWAVLTDWRGPGVQPAELATGLAALADRLAERRQIAVGRAYYEIYRRTVAALAERAAEPDRIG
ncbi:hypothetical protein [Planomonospora parontospora]|uniref:hypothetical protein n=1 Tax=Planomonospora parontospora TaxID=58119 RepID=UPI00166F8BE8|nr:hypothetical protein [Planomonospora parontospora]GGL48081.1 hypothetical protein GCM10014719_56700 [Planomonospora parontospora subsp. antibiotica]GII18788.1 hypothetical protein Ppa05_55140 [Planomonospora parontospora subsp. antibiotica]